jgi:hypothetical protein
MIVTLLEQLFAPLKLALSNRSSAKVLLTDLGWTLDETFELEALGPLMPILPRIEGLAAVAASYDPDDPDVGALIESSVLLGREIFDAITELQGMVEGGGPISLIAPLDTAAFWRDFALDLPKYLILTYLRTYQAPIHALIDFAGVIVLEDRSEPGRPKRETLDWEALGRFLTDPADQVADIYNWGGEIDHARLLDKLRALFRSLGVGMTYYTPSDTLAQQWFGGVAPPGVHMLGGSLLDAAIRMDAARLSYDDPVAAAQVVATRIGAVLDGVILPVPMPGQSGDPTGILLTFQALGQATIDLQLDSSWSAEFEVVVDPSGALGAHYSPAGVALVAGAPTGQAIARVLANPAQAFTLLGIPGSTRLELGGVTLETGFDAAGGAPEIWVDLALRDLSIVIAAGDGDGFLSNVLGAGEFEVPLEFGARWSTREGVILAGGAGVSFTIPINRKIGPLEIFDLDVDLRASTSGASLTAGVAGSLEIGPFVAVVDGIGFQVQLSPKPRGVQGNGGAVDVTVGFKPPIGLGLSVEVPGVRGGGYLEINHEEGRYFGVLDISLFGLSVTAIGLIATRLPDGSDGWSMYLSISVIFPGGIPLPFGFRLSGVGGLVGVNRGLDIEALGEGVRTGALDAILFPEDAVASAPMILNAIEGIFPAQQGQFVFGPIFRLEWGAASLVTIDLGVVIQLPDPVTISLLGSIAIRIGKDDVTIIDIEVDVVGTLWPTEGRLAIDSSIRRGQIAMLNLSGDMSVRLDLGAAQPTFLVANGGFHPQFEQPEGFPTLSRLALNLFDEPNLRIGVEAYLAVTSNSVQFGIAAYFWAKAIGLTADGRFEIDTLIYLRPFGLTASLGFQVTIKAGSTEVLQVTLRGTLNGPQPWTVTGYAEFKILGIKKKFRVEATLGRAIAEGPQDVADIFGTVLAALRDPANWGPGAVPGTVMAALSLSSEDDGELLHPAGSIEVAQSIAPLGVRLEKFGTARLGDDADYLEISAAEVGGRTVTLASVDDWFAPAQFFDMEEEDRVTAPSFESLQGGASLSRATTEFGAARVAPPGFESIIIDPDVEERWPTTGSAKTDLAERRVGRYLGLEVLSVTPMAGAFRTVFPESGFRVNPLTYVVRDQDGSTTVPESFAVALSRQRAASARRTDTVLQPAFEINLGEVIA